MAMLACVLHAAGDLRMEQMPLPSPGPGQVRLRLLAGGICGTDRHYFADGASGPYRLAEPLILGHEAAAEVDDIGDNVGGDIVRGKTVAVNPARFCGQCEFCRTGRANLCGDLFYYGSASRRPHMQGLFSEYFLADAKQCVVVDDGDPVRVSCAEPLAIALRAAGRGNVAGKNIMVAGCGAIGLLVVLAVRLEGAAHITAADVRANALAVARDIGADAVFNPPDIPRDLPPPQTVFECSGTADGLQLCLNACEKGGTVVQVGNLQPRATPENLPSVTAKELTITGVLRFADEFSRAVELLTSGRADISPLLSATCPLSDAPRAFSGGGKNAIKVHLLA